MPMLTPLAAVAMLAYFSKLICLALAQSMPSCMGVLSLGPHTMFEVEVLSGQRDRQQYVRHIAAVHSLLHVSAMQVGAHPSRAPIPALSAGNWTVYIVQPTL